MESLRRLLENQEVALPGPAPGGCVATVAAGLITSRGCAARGGPHRFVAYAQHEHPEVNVGFDFDRAAVFHSGQKL
jgi:hypothetical protein